MMQVTNEQVEQQLGAAPVEARIIRALLDTGISGAQPEWLEESDGKAKGLDQETALKLCKLPPQQELLDIALPSGDDNPGDLTLPLEELERLEPATPQIAEKARQFFLKPPEGWRFVPKQPQVKFVPHVGYSIGHTLISREVGVELMVRAMRCVVDDHNLLLLGGIERDTAIKVISAAVD
jgi:hypothetical protein